MSNAQLLLTLNSPVGGSKRPQTGTSRPVCARKQHWAIGIPLAIGWTWSSRSHGILVLPKMDLSNHFVSFLSFHFISMFIDFLPCLLSNFLSKISSFSKNSTKILFNILTNFHPLLMLFSRCFTLLSLPQIKSFKEPNLFLMSCIYFPPAALGVMQMYGLGTVRNEEEAYRCFKEASDRGSIYATANLIAIYFKRRLFKRAVDLAIEYAI